MKVSELIEVLKMCHQDMTVSIDDTEHGLVEIHRVYELKEIKYGEFKLSHTIVLDH